MANKNFIFINELGQGTHSNVYKAIDIKKNKEVALKIEKNYSSNTKESLLDSEIKAYNQLFFNEENQENVKGISKIYQDLKLQDVHFLSMELLGQSLDQLFNKCNKKFSLKTITMIAIQLLERIQFIHSKGVIHRDIKPGNLVIGGSEETKDIIYFIDFGLSQFFLEEQENSITTEVIDNKNIIQIAASKKQHIKPNTKSQFGGTPNFASIFSHQSYNQSRRDDLQQIFYTILYFYLQGNLPWSNEQGENLVEMFNNMLEKKISCNYDALGVPKEFQHLLNYSNGLKFDEEPDYEGLINLFKNFMKKNDFSLDILDFDWKSQPSQKKCLKQPGTYTSKLKKSDHFKNTNQEPVIQFSSQPKPSSQSKISFFPSRNKQNLLKQSSVVTKDTDTAIADQSSATVSITPNKRHSKNKSYAQFSQFKQQSSLQATAPMSKLPFSNLKKYQKIEILKNQQQQQQLQQEQKQQSTTFDNNSQKKIFFNNNSQHYISFYNNKELQ